jgi:polar amino acid transport system substrate-binding protein
MLSLGSILGSLVIGVAFALMRDSNNHLSRLLAITVGEGFRQTPPLLHLYIFIFGLGSYLSSSYDMRFNPLFIAIISFSLYAGAANGRILAQSLSFSRKKESDTTPLTKRLLNAFDACYESLVANSVNLVKLVGMASIIAVPEIIGSGNSIIVERGNQSTMMNILLIFYLIIVSLFLTVLRKGKGVTERWAKRIS